MVICIYSVMGDIDQNVSKYIQLYHLQRTKCLHIDGNPYSTFNTTFMWLYTLYDSIRINSTLNSFWKIKMTILEEQIREK